MCSAIKDGKSLMKTIIATDFLQARQIFEKEEKVFLECISGPFFKKRGLDSKNYVSITLSGKSAKAYYNDEIVVAHYLIFPENSAFIIFDKKSEKKDCVVNLSNLRFINE